MPGHSETDQSHLAAGMSAGLPIFIGYFPAAVAFGLLSRNGDLRFSEALLFSMTNFAGASQFLALNLAVSGAALYEVVVGVLLVNLRYLLMSASLRPRIAAALPVRALTAFGNTDEVFSVASLRPGVITPRFMAGIESVAWVGWVSGTCTGYLFGAVLPPSVQLAAGGTLYALFAALLVPEVKRERKTLVVAAFAAALNSLLVFGVGLSIGWAFVAAMIAAALFGAFYFTSGTPRKEAA